jgi:5-methylcytosine-specific restriction endonuclease McrA
VKIPEEYGIRATVVHDCYCCQNPRCRRITIRVHTHHIDPRFFGGGDQPWNLIALCPSCHLRGIHSDRMRLVRIGDWLVWSWPGGGVALTWSPVEAV